MNFKKNTVEKIGSFALAAAAWLCFSGMGDIINNSTVFVPEPPKNYTVELVDQSDMSVKLTRFSCAGATLVNGKMGRADVSIDFKKINAVSFLADGGNIVAKIFFKNSEIIELYLEKGMTCFGISPFGNFRIKVKDIKKISF